MWGQIFLKICTNVFKLPNRMILMMVAATTYSAPKTVLSTTCTPPPLQAGFRPL